MNTQLLDRIVTVTNGFKTVLTASALLGLGGYVVYRGDVEQGTGLILAGLAALGAKHAASRAERAATGGGN